MIAVVGAGAAGLVAAIFAAGGARRTLLLERTADGGRKILISGGGRCNILPSSLHPERFVTASPPHVMRGMLRSWPLVQQRAFFEEDAGIPLALEAETGKLFPRSNRARDVRDALVSMARARGVEIRFSTTVTGLTREGEGWRIATGSGSIEASRVVLATGGLSVPMTGSDGIGLRVAESLGHEVHATYPALTPIVSPGSRLGALAGVSLPARLRARSNGKVVETPRRVPVHPSRLQRPGGARHLARAGARSVGEPARVVERSHGAGVGRRPARRGGERHDHPGAAPARAARRGAGRRLGHPARSPDQRSCGGPSAMR